MTAQLRLILLAAGLSLLAAWSWWLYEHGRSVERGEQAQRANQAWAERFTLQAQLATRDQQLAEAQAAAGQVRTVEVIKREVVYRDRIKEVAVRDCVANSGLLQLYDAALGLSDTADGSDVHASAANGD